MKKFLAPFVALMLTVFSCGEPALAAVGQRVYLMNAYKNITSSTTTTVKSGGGLLHGFCVNTVGTGSTLTLYDNTAASGTKIGTWTTTTVGCYFLAVSFATGLTAVTGGTAGDITISYQ